MLNSICVCAVKYERIKFLVIALPDSIDIYAWAPKPYHKFMVFKVCCQVVMLIYCLWFASNLSTSDKRRVSNKRQASETHSNKH